MAKNLKPKVKPEQTEPDKWLQKIDRAKQVKKGWRDQFRVSLCYDYWEGNQRPPGVPGEEWITINLIYANLQAELPTLYSTDPYFYVKLAKSYSVNPMDIVQFESRAKVRQSMLNYLKGELELKDKARLSIFDGFFQYGVAKVCFYADMVENPDANNPLTLQDTDLPLLGENGEALLEPEYLPANEAYKIIRIHPDDFLVDEDAGPLEEDVSWKAHRIRRLLQEVKDDKKYDEKARNAVQATEISEDTWKEREQRKKGGLASATKATETPEYVILWEIYDLKNEKWLVVAEGCHDYLLKPSEIPTGMEKDPFVDLRFTKRDDSWYPLPPVSQWLDPQTDYCDARSKVKTHRKRFNRKYEAYMPGLEDDTEMTKLEVGADGTIIRTNQPLQVVKPIADAPLDQQIHMEIGYLRRDFEDVAFGANQRAAASSADSATEAGIIEKRAMIREGDKAGTVLDFLTKIGRKLDQLVQANITKDQAVKVSGIQGDFWELVKTSDYQEIAGEYEYSINVGNSTPQLPEIERAQWMAFLSLLAGFPQLALSKNLMKRMSEMHHIYDEAMIEELHEMAKQMMSGQLPIPGQQGSQPNVMQQNPAAIGPGTAMGMANVRGGQA